jgi:choline kinase
MTVVLPVVYLAAGEGRRLRPLTDAAPKAMLDVGGVSLAERALSTLRAAGVEEVVAVTGHARDALQPLGDLVSSERVNPRYAEHGNVYSLWCARDVVRRGCYVVNCDVLFEEAIARTLVGAAGSSVLCASDHGVDAESMKAVARGGRLEALSKDAPVGPHPEYIGLARIDPEHGPALAEALERFARHGPLDVYYEDAIQELARSAPVGVVAVDGLAWIEIDDHDDLAQARDEVLGRVA